MTLQEQARKVQTPSQTRLLLLKRLLKLLRATVTRQARMMKVAQKMTLESLSPQMMEVERQKLMKVKQFLNNQIPRPVMREMRPFLPMKEAQKTLMEMRAQATTLTAPTKQSMMESLSP